jgi:hypothetical protein
MMKWKAAEIICKHDHEQLIGKDSHEGSNTFFLNTILTLSWKRGINPSWNFNFFKSMGWIRQAK